MKNDDVFEMDISSDEARAYLYLNHSELTDNETDLFEHLIDACDGDGLSLLRPIVEHRKYLDMVIEMTKVNTRDLEQMRFTTWFLVDLMSISLKALRDAGASVPFMDMWPSMRDDILYDRHDLFHDEASEFVFNDDDEE